MTVDRSRTIVFFRFFVLDGSAGGGSGAPAGSVAGSTCNSASSGEVESVWTVPAFVLLFFFVETVDSFGSAKALVFETPRTVFPENIPCSVWGPGGAVVITGLSAVDISCSGPTFRRFFRFWVTEDVASGSVVICEALRFPRVRSPGSAEG